MTLERARSLSSALLYEGYALYPYRASALKNRKRFHFGVLAPPGCAAEASRMRTELLAQAPSDTTRLRLHVAVRFLQLVGSDVLEREMKLEGAPVAELLERPACLPLSGVDGILAHFEVTAEPVTTGVVRVAIEVSNDTPVADRGPDLTLTRSLISTHTLVFVEGGELVSLLDPPDELRAAVEACRNVGTWPVLVGEPWERTTMLSSPIILYDHARVAPESPGDLYDATEIDEILTLRTLTLTDDEKREVAFEPRLRALLERTEQLDEDALSRLHAAMRRGADAVFHLGERVRLRPGRRADVLDLALAGRAGTVAAVETDFEGRTYVAVTVDDDPGADLGAIGMPGHRFFFYADEVEPIQ